MQLIEHIFVREGEDVVKTLWEREEYFQAQLFALTDRLNNMNALNRRGYRKQLLKIIPLGFIVYDHNLS